MGQDKGMMYFKGQPMVSWVIQNLKEVTPLLSISTNDKAYECWGLPLIEDEVKDQGPLGGLISCLEQAQCEEVLVVSCDMPFVEPFILNLLLEEVAEVVLPEVSGRRYPLCAYYKRSCLPKLRALFLVGERKMHRVIEHLDSRVVSLPPSFEPYFQNINTPREKELLEQ